MIKKFILRVNLMKLTFDNLDGDTENMGIFIPSRFDFGFLIREPHRYKVEKFI